MSFLCFLCGIQVLHMYSGLMSFLSFWSRKGDGEVLSIKTRTSNSSVPLGYIAFIRRWLFFPLLLYDVLEVFVSPIDLRRRYSVTYEGEGCVQRLEKGGKDPRTKMRTASSEWTTRVPDSPRRSPQTFHWKKGTCQRGYETGKGVVRTKGATRPTRTSFLHFSFTSHPTLYLSDGYWMDISVSSGRLCLNRVGPSRIEI